MKALFCMALCGSLLGIIQAYKYFQDQIPNGENVPHPCIENHIWKGVGHKNRLGGGDRNPFGLAFAANGFKWDRSLCMKDSDGDEKTNGLELGDPDCVWTPGTAPAHKLGLSHPGICEPIDSPKCKEMNKDWDFCDQKEFDCPQIDSPDVQNITIKLDRTVVPPTETNYYCQVFDLPSDTDYHIIASRPALDNANVIHHMLLFGCSGDDPNNHMEKFRTPSLCSMQSTGVCGTLLMGWTVGSVGSCRNIPAGVKFGKTAVSRVLLQVHWNNPLKKPDYTDGSGITIYYTPKLKPNDIGTLIIGQMGLRIPGGKVSFSEEATCSSSCTQKMLNRTLNIVSVNPHMHYLGRGAYVDQYRDGVKVATLVDQDSYSYDSPNPTLHWPPKELQPGDELKIKCTFKSTSHDSAVYYGDGTQDEMCYGFVGYYPAIDGFRMCNNIGTFELCGNSDGTTALFKPVGGCDLSKADGLEMKAIYRQLFTQCDTSGKECRPSCLSLLTENPHPCLSSSAKIVQETILPRRMGEMGVTMQKASRSCDSIIYGDYNVISETSGTAFTLPKATFTLIAMTMAMGIVL